jgi:hypothetical protein
VIHQIVQIGDTHLNPGERNDTKRAALEQILVEGSSLPNLALWLWPGDLAHTRMAIADRNFLADYIQRLTRHAPLGLVYGNHDVVGELEIFTRLQTTWPVYLFTRPEVQIVPTATGVNAAIFGFPYPSRLGLVAAGTPSELVPERAREALDVIFIHAAADLAGTPAAFRLMAAHVNIGGAISSTGQPQIGREIELDPVLLGRLGDIPKLLSHIHKPQAVAGGYYAGSICGMDFGEREPKSYIVVDIDDADGAFTVTRRPLNVPRLFHVEGDLTREGFTWTCDETPDSWAHCEVRVRYRYVAADRDTLNFDLVTAPFVGARRIVPDPVPTHTRAIRAPAIVEAATEDAKVRAFLAGAGTAWTPGLEQKFAMLQLPDLTTFLNQLEIDLTGEPVEADPPPVEVCQ